MGARRLRFVSVCDNVERNKFMLKSGVEEERLRRGDGRRKVRERRVRITCVGEINVYVREREKEMLHGRTATRE